MNTTTIQKWGNGYAERWRSNSLKEMLSRITDKNRHGEVDLGNAVGNEIW